MYFMPKLLFDSAAYPALTYEDVCLVPSNSSQQRIEAVATKGEKRRLQQLRDAAEKARLVSRNAPEALARQQAFMTYLLLLGRRYPDTGRTVSRDEVDFAPVDGLGKMPIVVTNMNQISGMVMAETAACFGATAALPQDLLLHDVRDITERMHACDTRFMTPVMVREDATIAELIHALMTRDLDTALVQNPSGKFAGIVRMATDHEKLPGLGTVPHDMHKTKSIAEFVRPKKDCIVVGPSVTPDEALRLMDKHRLHLLPVVDSGNNIRGVLTRKFLAQRFRYHPHLSSHGGYAVLATVGALNRDPIRRVGRLLDAGVDHILLDTAHFDQGLETYGVLRRIRRMVEQTGAHARVIAGNVCTPEAVRSVIGAGAHTAKVGIGPGAMCKTRVETGVGLPQMTAILQCAEAAKELGANIWADGGIRYPRDVSLALAAGASHVMFGSMFAGTWESESDLERDEYGFFGTNYGMASQFASERRHRAQKKSGPAHVDLAFFRSVLGHRSEGIDRGIVRQRPGFESVADFLHWMVTGLTSAMTYVGARNLEEFAEMATIAVQQPSGFVEGLPKPTV